MDRVYSWLFYLFAGSLIGAFIGDPRSASTMFWIAGVVFCVGAVLLIMDYRVNKDQFRLPHIDNSVRPASPAPRKQPLAKPKEEGKIVFAKKVVQYRNGKKVVITPTNKKALRFRVKK